MLFRKNIDKACSYCARCGKIDNEMYLCKKKGIVSACHSCRKFKYDPLKRVPVRRAPEDFEQYDDIDYSL